MPMASQIVTFQIQTAVLSAKRSFRCTAANGCFEPEAVTAMRLMLRSAADLSSKRNSRPQAQHGNCLVNRVKRRVVQVL